MPIAFRMDGSMDIMNLKKRLSMTAIVLAVGLLSAPAFAQVERGLVSANNVDLHQSPDERSKITAKLYVGTMIQVDDFKEGWVHIRTQINRGQDKIPVNGWLKKSEVRSLNRRGFSWEGSNAPPADSGSWNTTTSSDTDTWGDSSSSSSSDDSWGSDSSSDTTGGDTWESNDDWSSDWSNEPAATSDSDWSWEGESTESADDSFDTPMGFDSGASSDSDPWSLDGDMDTSYDDVTDDSSDDDDALWDDTDF